jgi:uncharacterized membrane protein YeaQ/YmgE (transglycosylase-associated protein family)
MMDLFWFCLVGLIAGAIAKAIVPGTHKEPQGCLMTMFLGMAGSILVGFLMRLLFGTSGSGAFIPTIVGATIGAIILIVLFRKFWR